MYSTHQLAPTNMVLYTVRVVHVHVCTQFPRKTDYCSTQPSVMTEMMYNAHDGHSARGSCAEITNSITCTHRPLLLLRKQLCVYVHVHVCACSSDKSLHVSTIGGIHILS